MYAPSTSLAYIITNLVTFIVLRDNRDIRDRKREMIRTEKIIEILTYSLPSNQHAPGAVSLESETINLEEISAIFQSETLEAMLSTDILLAGNRDSSSGNIGGNSGVRCSDIGGDSGIRCRNNFDIGDLIHSGQRLEERFGDWERQDAIFPML